MELDSDGASGVRKRWPWLFLAAILLAYIATIALVRPAANFGALQDDAMYFASAKALAAGQGYIVPSFPDRLAASKYPELYAWLLSWVWRVDPSFPGNVVPAIGLTVAFGCWFLVVCFLLARKTMGLGDGWGLVVAGLCAFNFFGLLLGGSVLSDIPFAAMALTAALTADRSLEPGANWWWTVAAGLLAALSVGLRTLGIAVVAGILCVALIRRRYARACLLCLVAGAAGAPWLWPELMKTLARQPSSAPLPQGWLQTLAFYTSYIGPWRQNVPNWATARAVCVRNLVNLVEEPGAYLLLPLTNGIALLGVTCESLLSFAAWAGIWRRVRQSGMRAVFAIFLLYAAITVLWPWPPHRFLTPFQPLLFAGLAITVRDVGREILLALRLKTPAGNRAAAAALSLMVLALAGMIAVNSAYAVPKQLSSLMAAQRSMLAGKRQAYSWIRDDTALHATFIAYDDVLLYLYTGRQAIRPIACSTANFYRNDLAPAQSDAAHLGDVARHVAAAYWVVSGTDFAAEIGQDQDILTRKEAEILARLPVVYAKDGVRVYDLHCFQEPSASGCAAVFAKATGG